MKKIRVRFAPSPTGAPHVGNIRSAIFNWLFARHHNGSFILRIEDTDQQRSTKESLQQLLDSLRWLGLDWDEGPEKEGDYGPYFQSQRLDHYKNYIDQLITEGKAYACYCSRERLDEVRKKQQKEAGQPHYDRKCRQLSDEEKAEFESQGIKPVIRFTMPDTGTTEWDDLVRKKVAIENSQLDDYILLKSDGFPTYHLANVVDDHLMQISHVIRAEEWISSTPKHLLLYNALGLAAPQFVHVPLILGTDRSKLSKRHGETSLLEYRKKGYLPEVVLNFLSLLGWSPDNDQEILSRDELIRLFSLEGINKSASIFDVKKLDWMNKKYINSMQAHEVLEITKPYLLQQKFIEEKDLQDKREWLFKVMNLLRERLEKPADIVQLGRYFFTDDFEYDEKGVKKYFNNANGSLQNIEVLSSRLAGLSDFSSLAIEDIVRTLAEECSISASKLIHPVRLAVSGMTGGPGLFELMEVLGKEKIVSRINKVLRTY